MKALAVGVAALVLCGGAAAGGFVRARALEPAASFVAGKPVTVWCAKTQAAWTAYMVQTYGAVSGAQGSTTPGNNATFLSKNVCYPLTFTVQHGAVPYATLAPTIEVLTHEAIHARGESDEGVTDCAAIHEMPRVAVLYFHITAGKKLRALMAAAWKWRGHDDPVYNRVC